MAPKIYVSGALMAAANLDEARSKYEECASVLRNAGYAPYLPHRSTDPELMAEIAGVDVFDRDAKELMTSDAVVAFLDEPSLGVGAELAMCVAQGIPVVALMRPEARVSRFVFGMLESSDAVMVVTYRDMAELRDIVAARVADVLDTGAIARV